MPRYFIRISFMGTRYAGWQKQRNATAVQEILDESISTILGTRIETTGCGRTDTGVHASKFYAHFDAPGIITDNEGTLYKLNAVLPDDIAAHELIPVKEQAHARYDATLRRYKYLVTSDKNPFLQAYTCFNPFDLCVESMNEAAALLVGKSDYASFSRTNSQVKTTICHISEAVWTKNNMLVFTISADRFLRGMVRAVVGTMFDVGRKRLAPQEIVSILNARDRSKAGASAPARGLFLTEVIYPFIESSADSQTFPIVT